MLAMMACINVFAFEFDGINLNGSSTEILRAISKKHYVAQVENPNVLAGLCQGTKIYLSFDLENVTEKGHVGKLMVDVPDSDANAFVNNAQLLNIIYHLIETTDEGYVYSVDADGTKLLLSQGENSIRLTYFTPYFKAAK